jgi:hypothetical protein
MGKHKQQFLTFCGENEQGFVISVLLSILIVPSTIIFLASSGEYLAPQL